jgi:hypothetical protein
MSLTNWLPSFLKPTKVTKVVKVVETQIPVTKIETVTTEIPVEKFTIVEREIPVNKLEVVETQIPIEKLVQVEVQVPIDRIVQVEKEIPVPKVTEVIREIPVDKVQTVTKEIPVDKVHTIDREIPITKVEVHTTEVPITKVIEVSKEVPVDKVVQVNKEIPVDKVQIVEVEKPIFDPKVKSTLNTINNQIENVMGLKDLFKSKSNEFTEQYETLSKSINHLHESVEELNGVDFNNKIEMLYHKLDTVNEFLNKVKFRNTLETTNDIVVRELNETKSKLHVANIEIDKKQERINELEKSIVELESKLNGISNLHDTQLLQERYYQLIDFAFRNMDPFAKFDHAEARFYWENALKKK